MCPVTRTLERGVLARREVQSCQRCGGVAYLGHAGTRACPTARTPEGGLAGLPADNQPMGAVRPMDESKKNGAVIAVGNQKGGVGKTTNTVHVAAALGEMGRRVLVIDLDVA